MPLPPEETQQIRPKQEKNKANTLVHIICPHNRTTDKRTNHKKQDQQMKRAKKKKKKIGTKKNKD